MRDGLLGTRQSFVDSPRFARYHPTDSHERLVLICVVMGAKVSIPDMVSIMATRIAPPPAWALLERELIRTMDEAAELKVRKYSEHGGVTYYADDVDDIYEMIYNWGDFYAIGGNQTVLELALEHWNAATRFGDDSIVSRVHPRFTPQVNKEYYGLVHPGDAEWHHKGEGNMAFYGFGLADPTISENVRRAKRFASFYNGEDPEAPNYDAEHRVLRSPFQTGRGPWLKASAQQAHQYLYGPQVLSQQTRYYGVRASLYPIVKDLEVDWWEDLKRREEIVGLFEKIVLNSDSPNSLGATALMTNAYLYTGDEKYKRWVLEYTDVWIERMRANGGIIPDNVGPTGVVGENRNGQWWGGIYGWNSYCGFNIMFHSLTIAAECALLLTGDFGYLELLRSQIKLLIEHGKTREDGQLLMAVRHGPDGWGHLMWHPVTGLEQPVRMNELAHLYHASMSEDDRSLIKMVRDVDQERDWDLVDNEGADFYSGKLEYSRFQHFDGQNPNWAEETLRAELDGALKTYAQMLHDDRDVATIIEENRVAQNPVRTKALTHVALGAPQSVYHGGLSRATVRYYDNDLVRPGLPEDVAAFVDVLEADGVGIQLVNLSRTATRNLIVQAGAFGEHQFTEVRYDVNLVPVDSKYFEVSLPPSTSVRVEAGMRRFVNDPSYAFPWHGNKIPVPFQ